MLKGTETITILLDGNKYSEHLIDLNGDPDLTHKIAKKLDEVIEYLVNPFREVDNIEGFPPDPTTGTAYMVRPGKWVFFDGNNWVEFNPISLHISRENQESLNLF